MTGKAKMAVVGGVGEGRRREGKREERWRSDVFVRIGYVGVCSGCIRDARKFVGDRIVRKSSVGEKKRKKRVL